VAIGIIAVLIGILLPALSKARDAAAQAKCAAALRQIGGAIHLYANEFKGYAPPWRAGNTSGNSGGAGGIYNLYGIAYNSPTDDPGQSAMDACFWFDFLAKYLTSSKGGSGDATLVGQKQAQASVIWGCPKWDGYPVTAASSSAQMGNGGAGLNRQYVGYSYNYEPEMGPGLPFVNSGSLRYGQYSSDIRSADNFTSNNWSTTNNQKPKWHKLTQYKPAGGRAIVADSYDWKLEAQPWNGTGLFPQQKLLTMSGTVYASQGGTRAPGTTFDYYRHGKFPPIASTNSYFKSVGGRVAYNILFADGHVAESNDRSDAYRGMFQVFPPSLPGGSLSNSLPD
jgi:prepilin-type processing-associated H-X9-DG protein